MCSSSLLHFLFKITDTIVNRYLILLSAHSHFSLQRCAERLDLFFLLLFVFICLIFFFLYHLFSFFFRCRISWIPAMKGNAMSCAVPVVTNWQDYANAFDNSHHDKYLNSNFLFSLPGQKSGSADINQHGRSVYPRLNFLAQYYIIEWGWNGSNLSNTIWSYLYKY